MSNTLYCVAEIACKVECKVISSELFVPVVCKTNTPAVSEAPSTSRIRQ